MQRYLTKKSELFEGSDIKCCFLVQTYTRKFQCQFMLQRYPFDTQVKQKKASSSKLIFHQILIQGMLNQDGCIKAKLMKLQLLADKVFIFTIEDQKAT